MKLHFVVAPAVALTASLMAAWAFAAPPPPAASHAGHPGPPGSSRPDGKPGQRGADGRPGRPDGDHDHDHGGPRPMGSAFAAPSGSGPHHFGHGRPDDAGAPRDRGERARDHRGRLRARFKHMFHGQQPPGLAEEMKRHARRVARLERARSVAEEAKDTDAVARATKLLEKENQRHERWISGHAGPPAAPSAVAPAGSAP